MSLPHDPPMITKYEITAVTAQLKLVSSRKQVIAHRRVRMFADMTHVIMLQSRLDLLEDHSRARQQEG